MTTGTVSSSNLTSLYSNTTSFTAGVVNSSVFSVNGGTGVTVNPTTGNVVVNIGQDVSTSASVTFANLTATGNLSNNYYTLTNSAGIAGQVLTTDGLGVTTWTTPSSLGLVSSVSGTGAGISVSPTTGAVVVSNTGVTSIVAGTGISVSSATGAVTVNATGTTYTINAGTTTGGANLNLVGSDLTTDSVAYKGSGATTVTRTDANTITISSTAGTTIPNGTAQGQVLYWDGSAWTANSTITSAADADRLRLVYNNSTAGVSSALFVRKDFGGTAYTTNDGVGIGFQLDSTSQATNQIANINAVWNASAPVINLATNINNNTTGPFITAASFSTAAANIGGTTLTLDANNAGAANNSSIIANRGSSGTDASLTWTESTGFWVFNEDVFGQGEIIANTTVGTNGQYVTFNNEDLLPVGDCFLLVKRGSVDPDVMIKWNETTDRWEYTFDGTNYYYLANQNLDTTSDVNFSGVTLDTRSSINTFTQTTTSTSTITLATSGRTAMTVLVTAVQGANTHVVNATVLRNGANAMLTTYGEMYNSTSLVSFTADVSGGDIRLLITPTSATSTVFNAVRTSLS